jgi:hypothetical protein
MKIISNYKDYYDFLQMNGIDEKVVYDRRTEVQSHKGDFVKQNYAGPFMPKEKDNLAFFICGNVIRLQFKNNKWVRTIDNKLVEPDQQKITETLLCNKTKNKHYPSGYVAPNPNIDLDCPIVLKTGLDTIKNPKLSIFDFGKILSAENIYQMLYDWCSSTFIPEDNRTDKEKITGNGFDIKHSFRNTK